jgi:hypothetical protein
MQPDERKGTSITPPTTGLVWSILFNLLSLLHRNKLNATLHQAWLVNILTFSAFCNLKKKEEQT